ncbi:glucose 1-dehydrogenase [Kribbella sp. NBC_01245]|uniref:glucose 1-dehydrogenase n=1 Tax=Kribbella sp. NBC_01245 TaxID=2903578 RepID=UPI002E299014|nr:glucose 1-dehydrogenase [Kribbella sp. NBC_01245]
MQALTVRPGVTGSLSLRDVPEPRRGEGGLLVEALAVGLCGTDSEIINGEYGEAPPGEEFLVLGHENLGRVLEAPPASTLSVGDLVVGIVRRPDPEPCPACAAGEWDMCRNGHYTEHGIRGLHGFARARWRAEPEAVVRLHPSLGRLGVLLEPTTIVAKAWEQVERIGQRAFWHPQVIAITGAGPVGLLAALLGVQRGLRVHVFDRVTTGPKPDLVRSLGATYHHDSLPDSGIRADVLFECTGVPEVVVDVLRNSAPDAIVCLTGVSGVGTQLPLDVGALNREAVLGNRVVFGSVNANRRHYQQATRALTTADHAWLGRLITRTVPLHRYREAFSRQADDVKVVLDFEAAGQ